MPQAPISWPFARIDLPEGASGGTDWLQRCLRDVLSLVALPAMWSGRDQAHVLETLIEALASILDAPLIYAVAREPGSVLHEACRVEGVVPPDLAAVRACVAGCLEFPNPWTGTAALAPVGLGDLPCASTPIGAFGRLGAIFVASTATEFPTVEHETLLRVAASIGAAGLEQARLLRERELALLEREAALRAKDEFLAMLGHELRNPLTPIVTALELIQMRGETAARRELEVIGRQVHHMSRLVDDLLDVSRITQGKLTLRREPIEIARVVHAAIETVSPLLETRRHHLDASVPERGLCVDGDPTRLAQIAGNLLTNAAKFTPPGGHIRVQATREGSMVVVSVEDDGVGIAPDMLPKIFESFVQLRAAGEVASGGLGLGLVIARNLASMHGGTLTATSEGPGKGSQFTLHLPWLRPDDRQVAPAPGPAADPAGARQRVLIVDDNEDAAELVGELLRAVGHEVHVTHDGPSALKAIETFRPTVALIDIGLPVMDGHEVAARVRREHGAAAPRMIAVTGYGQECDRRRSRESGFEQHLTKPVDLEGLMAAVRDPR